MDKGEERVGLLCSAGARWAQVCSSALCPFSLLSAFPVIRRPLLSFLRNLSSEVSIFGFGFHLFLQQAVCSHQAGLDESERVAAGLHAPRKTHTFSPKRDHLLLQRDACVERRRKTGPDEKKSERVVVSFKIAVTEVVKTSSIWAPLA